MYNNQYDNIGRRVGLWEKYHSNGNLDFKGTYNDNGIKIGLWEDEDIITYYG